MGGGRLPGESRVGRKLSDLTIRRVICLVLLMMLVLPLLEISATEKFPTSARYGADLVQESFVDYHSEKASLQEQGLSTQSTHALELRERYERSLLNYVYYHNWYAAQLDSCKFDLQCSRDYNSNVYWIGLAASDAGVLESIIDDATVRQSTLTSFLDEKSTREATSSTAWLYNYGEMPSTVESKLSLNWTRRCDTSSGKYTRLGFTLLGENLGEPWDLDYVVPCPEDLRSVERKKYAPSLISTSDFKNWHFAFYFDIRPHTALESIFSLCITLFVCIALVTAAIMFSGDANKLVLTPVENMIAKVETIRDDPLMAMKMADREFRLEEKARMEQLKKRRRQDKSFYKRALSFLTCTGGSSTTVELMETVILEKTIIKLGSLLALGFGEAGAKIIGHNMRGAESASVDAMIPGTRVECVIGIARIRDFSTATEVLQAKVMAFVNQVAEIVHGVVDEFHGAANKNNGDVFLVVWITQDKDERRRKQADMSMLAFTRILAAVHRSPVLAAYRTHPGLQQRMVKRVNLTGGLHYGWAIEGAIGSEFKIDASYLSPHMSIAETVERATRMYDTSILVAESVKAICSPAVAAKCRLVDRVLITGSAEPMELYAVDLDVMALSVERLPPLKSDFTNRVRFKVRQYLDAEKRSKWSDDLSVAALFNENADISFMRARYTLEFQQVFNMGFQNYLMGEWQVAQRLLLRTRTMLGVEDGPSAALMRYMSSFGFQAPEKWRGYRDISQAALA